MHVLLALSRSITETFSTVSAFAFKIVQMLTGKDMLQA